MTQNTVTIPLEELIIGAQTDHGVEKAVGSYVRSDYSGDEYGIAAACAYGNMALDVAKRAGISRKRSNITSLASRIHNAVTLFVKDKVGEEDWAAHDDLHMQNINDRTNLGFEEIGARFKKAVTARHIPLDSPIEIELWGIETEE